MFQLDKKHQKYEKYNPTNVDWIGDIPDGWEIRRIKTFSQVRRWASPRPIDDPIYFDDNWEYSWVRIADVSASDRYLTEASQRLSVLWQSLSVQIEPWELFVSIAGTVGKPIISGIKCCIHDGFVYFKNLKYNKELLYWVFTGWEAYKWLGKLGTQLNLNTESIGNIALPFPSKEVQKKLTNYLDEKTAVLDEAIAKKKKQIELLAEHRTALINDAITKWLNPNAEMKDSGVEWIGMTPTSWKVQPLYSEVQENKQRNEWNINNNVLSLSYGKIIRRDVESNFWLLPDSFETYQIVDQWMIIMRLTDLQNDKKSLRVWFVQELWIITSAYVGLISKWWIIPSFLYQLLHSYDLQKVFYFLWGGVRQGMNYVDLRRLPIVIPSIEEQKQIIDYLDKETKYIDDMIAKIEKSIELLEEYKTSLISHVVSGKIQVS